MVQSGQKQDQGRFAGFVGTTRHRSQCRPARQSRRNFPREIRGEIRLVTPASLALVSQVGVILVHQSNVHKRVSAHYPRRLIVLIFSARYLRRANLGDIFFPANSISWKIIAFIAAFAESEMSLVSYISPVRFY